MNQKQMLCEHLNIRMTHPPAPHDAVIFMRCADCEWEGPGNFNENGKFRIFASFGPVGLPHVTPESLWKGER